jgi:hypothetical protein
MNLGREYLPYILNRNNLIGAEIGVESGLFSEYLLETKLFSKLYSIDPWPVKIPGVYIEGQQYYSHNNEETFETAKNRLQKYKNSEILRMTSEEASREFEMESLDFVFLDGDHTLQGVELDLKCWYDRVKKGGIFAGHDYMDYIMDCGGGIESHFSVKSAVDKFFAERNLEVMTVREIDSAKLEWIENYNSMPTWYSWYIIKT